jgi:hypothetical protein
MFYACRKSWGSSRRSEMHRLTARFLLLFAIVGSLTPIALAVTTGPPACCVRKAHHCHNTQAAESEQTSFGAPGCCNHDYRRAATTAQWAHPQPRAAQFLANGVERFITETQPVAHSAQALVLRSPRAPPTSSIA